MSYTLYQTDGLVSNTRREWSRTMKEEALQLLTAKRPKQLPIDAQTAVIYFKNINGLVATMSTDDYMNRRWRLSLVAQACVRDYATAEAIIKDGWVLR